jgi:uncharacterized protein
VTDPLDLSALPFVDAHMHPPYRTAPGGLDAYRWPWYEGDPADVALVADTAAYRWAIRQLARDLGCAAEEEAVFEAVRARDPKAWLREQLERGGVSGLVADMGYPPPAETFSPAELGEAGADVAPLLRIELEAGTLAAACPRFDEFVDRVDAALAGARDAGYMGLKSVLAYRSGLGVEPASASDAEAAFGRARAAARDGSPLFLTEKPLLDFLFERALAAARRNDMAMQVHAGYGDRDMDLPHCNPWLLRALLERSETARAVPIVLLHGSFPYTGEAAVLAAIHPNVYFDVATCVPPFTEAVQLDVWRTALAMVPLTRIHASTDAAGLAEQIALGARQARRTLGIALAELIDADVLDAGQAERVAADVLAGTARRIYFGAPAGSA